jgi:hypothetical protein
MTTTLVAVHMVNVGGTVRLLRGGDRFCLNQAWQHAWTLVLCTYSIVTYDTCLREITWLGCSGKGSTWTYLVIRIVSAVRETRHFNLQQPSIADRFGRKFPNFPYAVRYCDFSHDSDLDIDRYTDYDNRNLCLITLQCWTNLFLVLRRLQNVARTDGTVQTDHGAAGT